LIPNRGLDRLDFAPPLGPGEERRRLRRATLGPSFGGRWNAATSCLPRWPRGRSAEWRSLKPSADGTGRPQTAATLRPLRRPLALPLSRGTRAGDARECRVTGVEPAIARDPREPRRGTRDSEKVVRRRWSSGSRPPAWRPTSRGAHWTLVPGPGRAGEMPGLL